MSALPRSMDDRASAGHIRQSRLFSTSSWLSSRGRWRGCRSILAVVTAVAMTISPMRMPMTLAAGTASPMPGMAAPVPAGSPSANSSSSLTATHSIDTAIKTTNVSGHSNGESGPEPSGNRTASSLDNAGVDPARVADSPSAPGGPSHSQTDHRTFSSSEEKVSEHTQSARVTSDEANASVVSQTALLTKRDSTLRSLSSGDDRSQEGAKSNTPQPSPITTPDSLGKLLQPTDDQTPLSSGLISSRLSGPPSSATAKVGRVSATGTASTGGAWLIPNRRLQ